MLLRKAFPLIGSVTFSRLTSLTFSTTKNQQAYQELLDNPQFLNAFPHLKTRFLEISRERLKTESPAELLDGADLEDKKQKKHDPLDDFRNRRERGAKNQNYFESLFNRQYKYYEKDIIEKVQENQENYVEAYRTAEGPLRSMTTEAIDKVHAQVDIKMRELEQTGLSRTELLYDKAGGLPLVEDPVFQFLKRNRLARQMLFKPTELFTVERVVAKALRQDMKVDDSIGRQIPVTAGPRDQYEQYRDHKHKYRPHKSYPDPENFHSGPDWAKTKLTQMRRNSERAPIYLYRPLSRRKAYLQQKKKIERSDFDWEDIDLVCKFLTRTGMMMHRYRTRLPWQVQKYMHKLIRRLKDMELIPHAGNIKPSDRVPLKSLFQDIQDQLQQLIDPITGRIIPKLLSPVSDRQGRHRIKDGNIDSFTMQDEPREHKFIHNFKFQEERENLVQETEEERKYAPIKLDGQFFLADQTQLEWLKAKHYARHGVEGGKAPGEEKDAYNRIIQMLGKLEPSDLASAYMQESVLDVKSLEKRGSKVKYKEIEQKMKSKLELIQEITNILKKNNITTEDLMSLDDEYKIAAKSDAELNVHDPGFIELADDEEFETPKKRNNGRKIAKKE